MADPAQRRQKWRFSAFGLIIGILVGLFWFGLAFVTWLASNYVRMITQASGQGVSLTTNVLPFTSSEFYWVLIVPIIVLKIATWVIKEPLTVKGPVRLVLGTLTGIYTYLILAGGVLTVLAAYEKYVSVDFSVTVLVTLGFLELSALMTVLQGALEFREGRRMKLQD